MSDHFINVRQLIPQLLQFKADYPDKKIAFCFSGGGARGAYFGGVIEAIQQEINKQPSQSSLPLSERWRPDIICGSSAGALAGFSYWIDCLIPGSTSPYACRQSLVWKDVSDGNKGAEKLFSNHGVIDFLSGSSLKLDLFLDNIEKLQADIRLVADDIDNWWTDIKLVISNTASFDTNKLRNDIQSRLEGLKNDFDNVGSPPSFDAKHPLSVFNDIKSKFESLVNITGIIPGIISGVANMQIDQAKALLNNIQELRNDIMNGNKDIGKAVRDIRDVLDKFKALFKKIVETLKQSLKSIKDNSSLMNTEGLQGILESYIFNSLPPGSLTMVNGKIDARELDKAIIKLVKTKRDAGQNVPALFVTGTNINAKRSVAFSLAPDDLNIKVSNSNLWVIKLDEDGTDFSTNRMMPGSGPNEFVFGGKRFGTEYSYPAAITVPHTDFDPRQFEQATAHRAKLNIAGIHVVVENTSNEKGVNASTVTEKNTKEIKAEKGTVNKDSNTVNESSIANNFTDLEYDFTHGKSILVGAVLTSATIPVAFPPRQWTFFSRPPLQTRFIH